MKKMYSDIFKELLQGYYEGNFEVKVNHIINNSGLEKEEIGNIIASLSGVEVNFTEDFAKDLKEAIKEYDAKNKIVNKIKSCTMDCANEDGKTPCQRSCPFNAILIDNEKKTTYINNELCTDCGFCVEACKTGSLLDKTEFLPLAEILKGGDNVIATVAPAICGQFGEDVTIDQMRAAFKRMGFTDMVEVAFFADMLTLKESVEFDHLVKKADDLMITSCCCPMWVGMLKRVYKDLVKHVSPSVSPMIACGRVLKELNPNCKVVFIGPCIAKKAEAKEADLKGDVDYVLTFQELKDIFEVLKIKPAELQEDHSSEYASRGGRLYARTGGVSIAVGEAIERLFPEKYKLLKTIQAHGVKECKEMLTKAQNGEIGANFVEGMGCVGGCVGGPKAVVPKEAGKKAVDEFAEGSSIKVAVDSLCMLEILDRLGIKSVEDFKDSKKIEIFEREF